MVMAQFELTFQEPKSSEEVFAMGCSSSVDDSLNSRGCHENSSLQTSYHWRSTIHGEILWARKEWTGTQPGRRRADQINNLSLMNFTWSREKRRWICASCWLWGLLQVIWLAKQWGTSWSYRAETETGKHLIGFWTRANKLLANCCNIELPVL